MSRPEQDLLLSVDGAVATLTINRPAKRNALTPVMWRRLAEVCAELAADPGLRVLVVTGAGPSFCAGADISSLSQDEAELKAVVQTAERALRSLPMPSIAKVRGHCLGGGNQIAVACDLRVADSTATFGVPPARLGVVYPVGSTRALVELVGPAAAKRLIFTGTRSGSRCWRRWMPKECSVTGCGRRATERGWCHGTTCAGCGVGDVHPRPSARADG